MHLPLFIARRYLFAKKSHNVINIISAISAIGMAVGTAALILILSIYNGFDALVHDSLNSVEPDLLIVPERGKVFVPDSTAFDRMAGHPDIATICNILEEKVFLTYDGHQGIVRAKGVDRVYEEEAPIREHVQEGTFELHRYEKPWAAVGSGLAWQMGIRPRFVAFMELYYPARDRNLSVANPAASLNSVRLRPACLFSINSAVDQELVILPIEVMHELLGATGEVSALEIRLTDPSRLKKVQSDLQAILGPGFRVLDRLGQNPTLYKMMRYEKAAVFLILLFIIIVIAFNIFGSLSMLIIEKEEDIRTLRALGAQEKTIRRTFVLEGWLISLLGLAAGVVVGLGLALAQQHLGLVKMPGNFLTGAYPVIVKAGDILWTAAGVSLVGYIIARLPVRKLPR